MKKSVVLCIGACGILAPTVAHSAVVYRETFGNNTAGNLAISHASIGWAGHYGSGATASSGTGTPSVMASNLDGKPTNLANVNAGASTSQTFGFGAYIGNSGRSAIAWTSEYTLDSDAWSIDSFSWYEANGTSSIRERVAIRIGSTWYASTTQFGGTQLTAEEFDTLGVQRTLPFSTAASAWATLNFTPGSQLSLGSTLASPLPTGDITAFGLYTTIPNGSTRRTRFDTFQIDATPTPEPGAAALVIAAAGALLVRRRPARRA